MRFVSSTDKLATVDQARERMERWRAAGERGVFVSGAFDLLDVGALRALAEARAGAERLVVAVWDDAAARSVLGPGRPLVAAADRTMLRAALALIARLRKQHYDLAVDFFGNPRSALIAAACGARRSAGYELRGRAFAYGIRVARVVPTADGRPEYAAATHIRLACAVGGME